MWFLSAIIEKFNEAASFFYSVYLEVLGWVYPLWQAASFFYELSLVFSNLAWYFSYFYEWLDDLAGSIADILTFDSIYSYFSSYFEAAINAWNWVANAFNNVASILNSWWSATASTVFGWVEEAKQFALSLHASLLSSFDSLRAEWDSFQASLPSIDSILSWFTNWWGNILTNLNYWWTDRLLEIQDLISSKFAEFTPFWEGWQELKSEVTEFFSDPLQWIYDKLDEWFERFW